MTIRTPTAMAIGSLVMATASLSLSAAEIPERYQGTWDIDFNGTEALWRAWSDASGKPSPPKYRLERMRDERTRLTFTDNQVIIENDDGDREANAVTVLETTEEFLILSTIENPNRQLKLSVESDGGLTVSAVSGAEPPMRLLRRHEVPGNEDSGQRSDLTAYLDALAACRAGTFTTALPGAGTGVNTIDGREGNRCVVRTGTASREILCRYTDETIALMTSPDKYEDARNGIIRGSTDSEESRRIGEECAVRN